MRVLVVEDEKTIAEDIASALADAGYVVDIARDGNDAWFRAETENYEAIVLDLGLPRLDGISVLKKLRAARVGTPVLILTARDSWMERVDGFDAGADDYLPKPFHRQELVARLAAIIRRTGGHFSPILECGDLRIDTRRSAVTVADKPIALTALEYRAIRYLVHNRGRPVSRVELAEQVYGGEREPDSNALEVLVGRLRKKLGQDFISTRRGYGYVIED